MITILGLRRIIAFALLLALNAGLAYATFYYFQPANENLENDIRNLQSQAAEHWKQADSYTKDYQKILKLEEEYQKITNMNLVSTQNRNDMEALIDEIKRATGVEGTYTIGAGRVINDEQAQNAGFRILASPVNITMQSLDDIAVYEYIFWLENTIPGYAGLKRYNFQRIERFDESLLRRVGNGEDVPMIQGEVAFNWYSLVPEEIVDEENQ